MGNILTKKIPDLVITVFFFLLGAIFVSWLFYDDITVNHRTLWESFQVLYTSFPLIWAAIYLWGKAVYEDFRRIRLGIEIHAPGEIYYFTFLQYGLLWMANDFLYNNVGVRMGNASDLKKYLLFVHPSIIWIILDLPVYLYMVLSNWPINRRSGLPSLLRGFGYETNLVINYLLSTCGFIFIISVFEWI